MTRIDIFSGFLGAGKTTLIKKLIKEAYQGEKLVLIENEFGEIGVDGGFMQDAGIEITEMNSGCICCSLVGDFSKALKKVLADYAPDRILIEPSGVGKLSDVIKAVEGVCTDGVAALNSFTTVADVLKCKMYMKNFGEFYNDQIEHANAIILSRTDGIDEEKLEAAIALLREKNTEAAIISTPWDQLDGKVILDAMEHHGTMEAVLAELKAEAEAEADEDEDEDEHHHHHHDDDDDEHEHHHHHHDDDDEDEHEHHHHDDDDEDEHEHEHHHHDDDDEDEHEHHHHHHDDDDEDEDEHEHHHHHHHHADEVFVSWGVETAKKFGEKELAEILSQLSDEQKYGVILRAKGIVDCPDGSGWIYFDYVPGESDIRRGAAAVIGRLCVIGSKLNESAIKALFGVN